MYSKTISALIFIFFWGGGGGAYSRLGAFPTYSVMYLIINEVIFFDKNNNKKKIVKERPWNFVYHIRGAHQYIMIAINNPVPRARVPLDQGGGAGSGNEIARSRE